MLVRHLGQQGRNQFTPVWSAVACGRGSLADDALDSAFGDEHKRRASVVKRLADDRRELVKWFAAGRENQCGTSRDAASPAPPAPSKVMFSPCRSGQPRMLISTREGNCREHQRSVD
jgi:hypothetical protein